MLNSQLRRAFLLSKHYSCKRIMNLFTVTDYHVALQHVALVPEQGNNTVTVACLQSNFDSMFKTLRLSSFFCAYVAYV